MTIFFVLLCQKYDQSQDLEKANKDLINSADKKKVGIKKITLLLKI